MTLTEFLTWLVSSAGASTALSFIAERLPAFQKLPASAKGYTMLVGSLVIAGLAYAVLHFTPPDMLAQLVPWFQIAYGVVGAWIANQLAHKADPAADTSKMIAGGDVH